jgi:hypothetical protein
VTTQRRQNIFQARLFEKTDDDGDEEPNLTHIARLYTEERERRFFFFFHKRISYY